MATFVSLLVHSHPEALRIVEALAGGPILPPESAGDDAIVTACGARVVEFFQVTHRSLNRHDLEEQLRRGAEHARRTFDPADEIPFANPAWTCIARSRRSAPSASGGP
jgi:hypothetical protein